MHFYACVAALIRQIPPRKVVTYGQVAVLPRGTGATMAPCSAADSA